MHMALAVSEILVTLGAAIQKYAMATPYCHLSLARSSPLFSDSVKLILSRLGADALLSQTTDAAALLAAGVGGGAAAARDIMALQSARLLAEVLQELILVVLVEWASLAQSAATAAAVFFIASDALPKPG